MNILIAIAEACKDNYVVTCNPAPKTPASEVVVQLTETLAATGQDDSIFGIAAVGILLVAGGLIRFLLWPRKRN